MRPAFAYDCFAASVVTVGLVVPQKFCQRCVNNQVSRVPHFQAEIYIGKSPDRLEPIDEVTPYKKSYSDIRAGWNARYYQVRKSGYRDSEVTYRPGTTGADHNIHFILEPITP